MKNNNVLLLVVLSLLLVGSYSSKAEYVYFYPPLEETGNLGMGYIVMIGCGCVSYDAQGWAAIANYDTSSDNSISLELYNNYNCQGDAEYTNSFNGNSSIYTIPFNKYDHNNLFIVGVNNPPFSVDTIMVMQFYTTENPQCLGDALALKMFINGTYFNSTTPTEQVYCINDIPMNTACMAGKCQTMEYPTGCTQYFSKEIYSNFFCRSNSPIPSQGSSSGSTRSITSTGRIDSTIT